VHTEQQQQLQASIAAAASYTAQHSLSCPPSRFPLSQVRKFAKPEWDVEPSSLDPIDDIETFYDYDFKLPPDAYDAYQAAAKLKLDQLEELKDAPGGWPVPDTRPIFCMHCV
jgi:hypothetical protein